MRERREVELLDTEFDDLIVNSSLPIRVRIPTTPHCDCEEANFAHFGGKRKTKSTHPRLFMCPVEADGDLCPHCGHHVLLKVPVPKEEQVRNGRKSSGAVVGVNLVTLERREFSSAKNAAKAGFPSIYHSLKHNRPAAGWQWSRAK